MNGRSDVQGTALATTFTGSCHKTGPNNINTYIAPHPLRKQQPPCILDTTHTTQHYNASV